MVLLADVAIVVVVAVFALLGAKRGFIRSLCGVIAVVVALVVASFGAKALAPRVSAALEPKFSEAIEARLNEGMASAVEHGKNQLEEGVLSGVLDFLKDIGVYREMADATQKAIEKGMTSVAALAAARLAATVAEAVAFPLLFFLLFLLAMLAWSLISRILDVIFQFPVLSGLNQAGGGILGALKGLVVVFLVVWLLNQIGLLPPEEELERTFLLEFFANTNPLTLITR